MPSFDEERIFDMQRRAYIRQRNKIKYEENLHKYDGIVTIIILCLCLLTAILLYNLL